MIPRLHAKTSDLIGPHFPWITAAAFWLVSLTPSSISTPALPVQVEINKATPVHLLHILAKITYHLESLWQADPKRGLFIFKYVVSRPFLPYNSSFRAAWLEMGSVDERPAALQSAFSRPTLNLPIHQQPGTVAFSLCPPVSLSWLMPP